MKLLVIGVATATAITGAAAAQLAAPATAHARPAVFGVPLPRDPAPNMPTGVQQVPTSNQVTRILTDLTDPSVPDRAKNDLVQGGIDSERRAFTHNRLKLAVEHGELPLSFAVGNIWPVGPNTAAAQVTASGPKLPAPAVKVLTFVDQGGWMLSSDSAAALIQAVAKN